MSEPLSPFGLPSGLPSKAGPARSAAILAALDAGKVTASWSSVIASANGHTGTFYVLTDALKINDVRLSTSAFTLQIIADKLNACLMTPRLIDLAFLQAKIVIPPQPLYPPGDSTALMAHESRMIDAAIRKVEGADTTFRLLAPIGKNWCLSNEILKAQPGYAALYGWAVTRDFGSKIQSELPGIKLHKGTLPGIANIQPLATVHEMHYEDYAMLTSLVLRTCIVDGQKMDLRDVLASSELSALVSHEGPLKIARQPGVPESAPIGAPVRINTSGVAALPVMSRAAKMLDFLDGVPEVKDTEKSLSKNIRTAVLNFATFPLSVLLCRAMIAYRTGKMPGRRDNGGGYGGGGGR